jgi:hypothetical protein
MINTDPVPWLNINASATVFDYRLEGTVENEDVSTQSTNWNGRMNLTFKLKNNIRTQVTGYYRGPSVTAQGRREGYPSLNMAVRKDFFDRRFSATLAVRDLFASARREMITEGEGFYTYDNFRREAPILTLNLSYIINNYKTQEERRGGEGMNGEEMDIDM